MNRIILSLKWEACSVPSLDFLFVVQAHCACVLISSLNCFLSSLYIKKLTP